jgi:hypothetical protein
MPRSQAEAQEGDLIPRWVRVARIRRFSTENLVTMGRLMNPATPGRNAHRSWPCHGARATKDTSWLPRRGANRSMKLGSSEIARLLDIDRDLVKVWSYRFREHLSSGANPDKGGARRFSLTDLRVFLYVYSLWEAEPDFECINIGLNRGLHLDDEYDDVLASVIPIFAEPPENLDESFRGGALVGGMAAGAFETFSLADSYKLAGDVLVDAALSTDGANDMIYPILFNYRHATELYLKAIGAPTKVGHSLTPLLDALRSLLRRDHSAEIPDWFEKVVKAFDEFDPGSTYFRYSQLCLKPTGSGGGDEAWVDLSNLKRKMSLMSESFQRIRRARQQMDIEKAVASDFSE